MRPHATMPRQDGSTLIEGLLAIVVFSVALVGLLRLLSATLADGANAQYRSEASLLASDLVARMWHGDRSPDGLKKRFGSADTDDYRDWMQRVQATLPGVSASTHVPSVAISDTREVTITLNWQTPGSAEPHSLVVHTLISD